MYVKKVAAVFIVIAFVLSMYSVVSAASPASPGMHSGTMKFGGYDRTYQYYVPSSYNPNKSLPLMLSFHGSGSSADGQILLTKYHEVAEKEGFIVVFPDSTVINPAGEVYTPESNAYDPLNQDIRRWNINTPAATPAMATLLTIDDVGFTAALIDKFATEYNIDESRVYATGMSWGGFFSNHLAVELNGRIAGIGAVTGQMALSTPQTQLKRGVAAVYVMGDKDPTVPPTGIPGLTYSVNDSISYWKHTNRTAPKSQVTYLPQIDAEISQAHFGLPAVKDDTKIRREAFTKGKHQSEVILYTVEGGGHTWPMGPQYLPVALIGKTSQQMNASEVIWNDLKKHRIAGLQGKK